MVDLVGWQVEALVQLEEVQEEQVWSLGQEDLGESEQEHLNLEKVSYHILFLSVCNPSPSYMPILQ